MQYRALKDTGIDISTVALGTWAVGGGSWWGNSDDTESIKAIQAAVDSGINLIDTAPAYGFGKSEEVVGKAIEGKRDKVVLSTKCGLRWKDSRGAFKFELNGNRVNIYLHPDTIRVELEDSLRRLKTDYIDIYFTHWQSVEPGFVAIEDTMAALLKLKDQGKIRAIGASNISPGQIKEYEKFGSLDVIQPKYSMLARTIEDEVLPLCITRSIGTMAYSPLEQGLLAGKYTKETVIPEGQYRNNLSWFQPGNRERVIDMLDSWKDLLDKYNCKLSQLVIAWTTSVPGITTALCGGRKVSHVEENAGAGDIILEKEDTDRIKKDVVNLGQPV